MFYIKVQDLDYDDYPRGSSTKIGPFNSSAEVDVFLDESPYFFRQKVFGDYYEWKMRDRWGNHSVSICPMSDGMLCPSNFLS